MRDVTAMMSYGRQNRDSTGATDFVGGRGGDVACLYIGRGPSRREPQSVIETSLSQTGGR